VIECRATDGVAPAATTATSYAPMSCRHVVEADNERLHECRKRAATLVARSRIPPILHPIAPDPPPDLLAGIYIVRELAAVAQQAAEKGDKETLALLQSVLTDTLHFPPALFAPAKQRGGPVQ
jgi:hypothetical protein